MMMDGLLLVCLTGICASPDPLMLYERVAPQAERAESVMSASEQPSTDRTVSPSPAPSIRASSAAPIGATIQAPAAIDSEAAGDAIGDGTGPKATSRSAIAGIVEANADAIRRCYERGLAVDPSFKGTIEMGWKIDRAGRVTSTNVVSTSKGGGPVEGCLRGAITTWTFPASAEPVVVGAYPFTFDVTLLRHHRTAARPR
jgi:hypothetical protein